MLKEVLEAGGWYQMVFRNINWLIIPKSTNLIHHVSWLSMKNHMIDHLNSTRRIKKLLEKCERHDPFGTPTTPFLFGLLSEQGMRKMEHIFSCKLSQERKRDLLQKVEAEVRRGHPSLPPYSLQVLRCLYEIQDEDFLTQAMAHFQRTRMYVRTDLELLVFTFCVKFCHHVERLQLNESGPHRQAWRPSSVVLWVPPPTPLSSSSVGSTLLGTGG